MYDERAQIAKLEHARLYPNYRFTPMKRVDKDRMREEKRQAKEQDRARRRTTRGHALLSPTASTSTPRAPQVAQTVLLNSSTASPPVSSASSPLPGTHRRLPVQISHCATGRLMHHTTRVRVHGQTQPTHTVHRRVHRPIPGPIYLSQPLYPLSPRACSFPCLRVSLTGLAAPAIGSINNLLQPSTVIHAHGLATACSSVERSTATTQCTSRFLRSTIPSLFLAYDNRCLCLAE